MENNSSGNRYKVYIIAYTDLNGNRTRAEVSEESTAKALLNLEEALVHLGYSGKNIENMLPIIKTTENLDSKIYIKFRI